MAISLRAAQRSELKNAANSTEGITQSSVNYLHKRIMQNGKFHVKPVFLISLVVTCTLMSYLKGSFRLSLLWIKLQEKVHFKRCLSKCRGRGGELSRPEALNSQGKLVWVETEDRRKQFMVPCHGCHIYGTWSSKIAKRGVKVII